MIYGFYFRFYRMTHCKWFSALLAHLAYAIIFCKYLLERLGCRKKIVTVEHEDALRIISRIHPDPQGVAVVETMQVDEALDLSIIVPVYNYVELIENNIKSILAQKTKYTFQLILVDDGSTDGAQDVLHRYEGHSNVQVIFQKNQVRRLLSRGVA